MKLRRLPFSSAPGRCHTLVMLLAVAASAPSLGACAGRFDLSGYSTENYKPLPGASASSKQLRQIQATYCIDAANSISRSSKRLQAVGWVTQLTGWLSAGTSAVFLAGAPLLNDGGPKQEQWTRRGVMLGAFSGAVLALNAIVDFDSRGSERDVAAVRVSQYAFSHAQGVDDWGDDNNNKDSYELCIDTIAGLAAKRTFESDGSITPPPAPSKKQEAQKAKDAAVAASNALVVANLEIETAKKAAAIAERKAVVLEADARDAKTKATKAVKQEAEAREEATEAQEALADARNKEAATKIAKKKEEEAKEAEAAARAATIASARAEEKRQKSAAAKEAADRERARAKAEQERRAAASEAADDEAKRLAKAEAKEAAEKTQ